MGQKLVFLEMFKHERRDHTFDMTDKCETGLQHADKLLSKPSFYSNGVRNYLCMMMENSWFRENG